MIKEDKLLYLLRFYKQTTSVEWRNAMKLLDKLRAGNTDRHDDHLPVHIHLLAVSCATIVAILAYALPSDSRNRDFNEERTELHDITQISLDLPNPSTTVLPSDHNLPSGSVPHSEAIVDRWDTATVRPGDTLSQIFSRLSLPAEDLYTLISSKKAVGSLTHLRPGQVLKLHRDPQGKLLELIHEMDVLHGMRFVREGPGFKVSRYSHESEKRTAFKTGVIQRSLYESALSAGLSDRLIMELVEIFGWDIDFALDIHPGDNFAVVFEEEYFSGRKIGNGEILAAQFSNRGKTYRAVRYTNPAGVTAYYTPEGRSMRQAFLRSPVDFRRISSHFQPSRYHPVLGRKRPHRGVDYAAATGTPIKASGDGKVIFIGRKGGYGNTVILKHWQRYTTLYGHMSRFKKGLRRGDSVNQGDIIGYVGKTGLATGPHLHYEFRINGVHQNPVTVKLPGSPPIESRYLADFRKKTAGVIAQLDFYSRTQLALNSK